MGRRIVRVRYFTAYNAFGGCEDYEIDGYGKAGANRTILLNVYIWGPNNKRDWQVDQFRYG